MVSFPPPTQVPFCVNISSTCYHKKQMIQLWHCDADLGSETAVLWPPHAKSWLIGKDSDAGRDWGQEEKGTTEDEMAGWDHRLDRHESEQALGVGDGQGSLECAVHGVSKSWTWLSEWTELNGKLPKGFGQEEMWPNLYSKKDSCWTCISSHDRVTGTRHDLPLKTVIKLGKYLKKLSSDIE